MRIIARIDIKNNFVIKGINLEGLRKIGNPIEIASKYYNEGIDEIIFIDAVASLYKRNNLYHIVDESVKNIFVPLTIGGGIRTLKDIEKALKSGADKVAINSYATEKPFFLKEAVNNFGSSSIISYIETKEISNKNWEVYKYSGREKTGINVEEWIKKVQDFGCGEILLTPIDYEGTQKGFDLDILNRIYDIINIPLIISGGCGNISHITELKNKFSDVSVALASSLHYKKIEIKEIKKKIK
tara:strand:- start:1092 stop:1817 length:726 start_codon:yes stop_codon:yes gene_type:complete